MKTKLLSCVLPLLFLIASYAHGEQATGANKAQVLLDNLVRNLDRSASIRVEILHMPEEISTPFASTPERLETHAFFKLSIFDVRYRDKFFEALKSMEVEPMPYMVDIRWGAIFYSGLDDNSRIGAIYFDLWGHGGAVNGEPVSFKKGTFFEWLDRNFSHCFRSFRYLK